MNKKHCPAAKKNSKKEIGLQSDSITTSSKQPATHLTADLNAPTFINVHFSKTKIKLRDIAQCKLK